MIYERCNPRKKKKDVEDKCLDTVGAHTHTHHTHDSQSVFCAALSQKTAVK